MNTPYWFSNFTYWSAQVALLVLAAGFLPNLFKIRQPSVLLIYWRALIAICLLLPFAQPWHQPEYLNSTSSVRFGEATATIGSSGPVVSSWHFPIMSTIGFTIGFVILGGIAVRFAILALGLVKLHQFRKASFPISDHAGSIAVLDEMRVRVNTGGEFRISSNIESPVTFGLSAPVILLPERFPSLDAQHQSAIACHELLHVRRGDWAHHLTEEIVRAALWFHPAIMWLIARIRLSREQVVDLEVVRLTDARKQYLEALMEFTNSRSLATIPAPPFLVERQLAERVALILKEVRMSRTRLIASLSAIVACLAIVATLAVWAFPLKAAPRVALNAPQDGIINGVVGGVTSGVLNGVVGGVFGGVSGGVSSGVSLRGPSQGVIGGVPGGIDGGVSGQVEGRIARRVAGSVIRRVIANVKIDSQPQQPDPARQSTSGQTYRAGQNGVSMPTCEYCPKPEYSEEARSENFSGTVTLQVVILKDGRVGEIKVIKPLSKGLDQQAISAIRNRWTFKPAVDTNGDPEDVTVPVEVSFQLFPPPASSPAARSQNPPPAQAPSKSSEGVNVKIFTGPVSGYGENTPFYNGRVRMQTLSAPNPEFPRDAMRANLHEGSVTLDIIVNTEGKVISAQVVKTSDSVFNQAALDAVHKWTITGTHDGVPVTFQTQVEMSFKTK